MTTSPLEQLHRAVDAVPGPDESSAAAATERVGQVIRPAGALARLDTVAIWLAGWQRTTRPALQRPAVVVFGGDHGVALRGVSAYPPEVTKAMAAAIENGIATSSAMAVAVGASLRFVDVGVGEPTHDITVADAMSHERFAASWEAGRAAVAASDADVVVLGELGIGNTTAAAAIAAALFGGPVEQWVGRGTGLDDAGLERKRDVVRAAVERIASGPPEQRTPLEVLRRVGGTELVAIAGAAVEARRRSLPLVLDGFIATAALAPLERARPGALDHAIAGHVSAEPGHRRLLVALAKEALIDLDLRLGEATGALVALPIVRLAAAALSNVATFDEAGVAGPE